MLHDATMLPKLLGFLTVQVSDMFRDRPISAPSGSASFPIFGAYPSLKVFVPAAVRARSSTFVILFREEGLEDRTLFYATDVNQDALAKAESGIL